MWKIIPILFAVFMATIDAIVLPIIKYISEGVFPIKYMLIPVIIYACQPIIFYFSLKFATLTSMNILWDLMSDVIVTLIGLFYLKEKLHISSKYGLVFAFIAILFFARDGVKQKI